MAIRDLEPATAGRTVDFEVGELPAAHGDAAMLQQVWANLLGNAVKYTGPRDRAVITIGAEVRDGVTVYFVRDNGVGFDMQICGQAVRRLPTPARIGVPRHRRRALHCQANHHAPWRAHLGGERS